jgi:hypothetical protein
MLESPAALQEHLGNALTIIRRDVEAAAAAQQTPAADDDQHGGSCHRRHAIASARAAAATATASETTNARERAYDDSRRAGTESRASSLASKHTG